MNIYFSSYLFICLFALIYPFFSQKMKWIPCMFSFSIPAFLICFRDMSIGRDAAIYSEVFVRLKNTSWLDFIFDNSFLDYKLSNKRNKFNYPRNIQLFYLIIL